MELVCPLRRERGGTAAFDWPSHGSNAAVLVALPRGFLYALVLKKARQRAIASSLHAQTWDIGKGNKGKKEKDSADASRGSAVGHGPLSAADAPLLWSAHTVLRPKKKGGNGDNDVVLAHRIFLLYAQARV